MADKYDKMAHDILGELEDGGYVGSWCRYDVAKAVAKALRNTASATYEETLDLIDQMCRDRPQIVIVTEGAINPVDAACCALRHLEKCVETVKENHASLPKGRAP